MRLVICYDSAQTNGGQICCDTAEELGFDKSAILKELKECECSYIHKEQ